MCGLVPPPPVCVQVTCISAVLSLNGLPKSISDIFHSVVVDILRLFHVLTYVGEIYTASY